MMCVSLLLLVFSFLFISRIRLVSPSSFWLMPAVRTLLQFLLILSRVPAPFIHFARPLRDLRRFWVTLLVLASSFPHSSSSRCPLTCTDNLATSLSPVRRSAVVQSIGHPYQPSNGFLHGARRFPTSIPFSSDTEDTAPCPRASTPPV